MNVSILEKILTSEQEYWILRKNNDTYGINAQSFKPSVIMCVIPKEITQGLKREDIKLTDLEELQSIYFTNIFLNEDYPPFQSGQDFHNITEAYPIPCKQKEFLIKALALDSDDIWDYKKIIDEICINTIKNENYDTTKNY
jgi:hypothetical protein